MFMWHFIDILLASLHQVYIASNNLFIFANVFGACSLYTWEVGVVINTHTCESCFNVRCTPKVPYLILH